ncbi:MAG: hypothetical protein H5U20_12790 [Rhodobacteraceae bacterium]|nr:hypothetical protein [Paracoccaceae bacterium]
MHRTAALTLAALLAATLAGPVAAQTAPAQPAPAQAEWGDLAATMAAALGDPAGWEGGAFWMPDAAEPGRAREALAIVYPYIEGSAGSVGIEVAHFVRQGGGFAAAGRVQGLFGQSPRDIRFHPDRIELTTTMPNPGDPRCCPTGTARWAIPRANLVAQRIE